MLQLLSLQIPPKTFLKKCTDFGLNRKKVRPTRYQFGFSRPTLSPFHFQSFQIHGSLLVEALTLWKGRSGNHAICSLYFLLSENPSTYTSPILVPFFLSLCWEVLSIQFHSLKVVRTLASFADDCI